MVRYPTRPRLPSINTTDFQVEGGRRYYALLLCHHAYKSLQCLIGGLPHHTSSLFKLRNHINDIFAGLAADKYCKAGQCSPGHVWSFQTNTQGLCAGMKAGLPLPYRSQTKAVVPAQKEPDAVLEGHLSSVLMRSCMLLTKHCNRANSWKVC